MTNIMNSSAKKGKTRRLSLNEPDLDSIIDRAQRRLVNPYRRTESVKSLKTQWTQETSASDSESSVSSISLSVAIQDDEEDRWFSDSDPVQCQGRFRSQVVPTMESLLNTSAIKPSNRKKKKKKSKQPNRAAAPPRRRRASSTEVLERRSKGFRDFAMTPLENKKGFNAAKNNARPALSDTRKKTGTDNALMDMFSSQALLNPEKSPPKQLSTRRSSEDLLGLFQVRNNNNATTGTPKSASSAAAASRRRRSTVREFEDIDERELSNTNLDVKVDPSLLMAEAIPHSDEGGMEESNNNNKKSKKKKKRKDKKSGSGSTASKKKTPPPQVRRKSFEAEDAMDPSKHASNNNSNGTKKKLSFGPSRSSDSLFPSLTRSESARFKSSGNAWLTGRYMQNDTWGGEDEAKSEELVERPSVAKLSGSALKRSKSTDDQPKLAADREEQQGTSSSSSSNKPSSTALLPLPALKPSTRDPRASLRNRFTRTSSVPMFKVGESNPRAQAIERTIEREISRRSLPDEDTGKNNFAYSNTTILPTFDIPTIHPRSRIMERAYSQRDIHSADECDDLLKDDANSDDDDDEDDNGGVTMSLLGGGRTDRFDHFGRGAASDSDNDDDDDDDDDGDDQGKATSMLNYLKNRRRSSGRGRSTDLGSSSHSQKKRTGSSDSTAKRIGRGFLGRATSLRFQEELDASKHKETNRRRRHSLTEGEPPKKAGFLKLDCDDFSQGALDLSDDDDDNANGTPVSRNEAAVGKPSKKSNRSPSRKQERPDSVPPPRTMSDDSNANTSFRSTKSDSSDVRSTSHKSERSKKKKKKSSKKPKSDRYESNFERFLELNNYKNNKGDSNRLSSSKSAVSKSRSVATSRHRSKSRKSRSKEFGRSESDDYMLSKSDDELFCDQKDRKKKKKKSRDDKSERSKKKKKDETGLSVSTRETRAEREEVRQSRRRRSIEEKMSKAETGPTMDRDPLSKSDRRR